MMAATLVLLLGWWWPWGGHPLDRLASAALRADGLTSRYEDPKLDTPACRARFVDLLAVARDQGIAVEPLMLDSRFGFAEGNRIVLDADLSSCGRVEVMAHELAHLLGPRFTGQRAASEVFADAVSYLVAREVLPTDPLPRYARYLAGYKHGLTVLDLYRREIDTVARMLRAR